MQKENSALSSQLKQIIESLHPQPTEISLAVINLKTSEPEIAGYNMDHFIYPASVYKVFVGAEILRKVYIHEKTLNDVVEINSPNNSDKDFSDFPFPKEKGNEPLLKAGDRATIDHLLKLMFSRSDNTAANVLIDIADREQINKYIILSNGWQGSEVTRKFLDRSKEPKKYQRAEPTTSCARHLTELFYKIENKQLVNEWVSEKLKEYMLQWDRRGRTGLYISQFTNYYRKGGWLDVNGYTVDFWKALKHAWQKGYAINRWSNDVGVVETHNTHYVIAILALTKSKWPWVRFPMKKLARKVHKLMKI